VVGLGSIIQEVGIKMLEEPGYGTSIPLS